MRPGFITKKEFCREFNISYKLFDSKMLELGYVKEIYLRHGARNPSKRFLTIGENAGERIQSTKSGKKSTIQYSKKLLVEVFDINPKGITNTLERINRELGSTKMYFGKYKDKKLKDIPKDYLVWLEDQHFCPNPVKRYVAAFRKLHGFRY